MEISRSAASACDALSDTIQITRKLVNVVERITLRHSAVSQLRKGAWLQRSFTLSSITYQVRSADHTRSSRVVTLKSVSQPIQWNWTVGGGARPTNIMMPSPPGF